MSSTPISVSNQIISILASMKFEYIIIIKNIKLQDQILTTLLLNTKLEAKVVAAIVVSTEPINLSMMNFKTIHSSSNPIKLLIYWPSYSK